LVVRQGERRKYGFGVVAWVQFFLSYQVCARTEGGRDALLNLEYRRSIPVLPVFLSFFFFFLSDFVTVSLS
jgi:hypothetical protein